MTYFVGADVGTSSVKLLLINEEGAPCARQEEGYLLTSKNPGWIEIDPELWFQATMKGMHKLLAEAERGQVKGIGFTGQMHTVVFLDNQGGSIRPAISWNDTRTADIVRQLKAEIAEDHGMGSIGEILSTGSPAANLLWLRRAEPENFERLYRILIGPDYLTYRFSGVYGTDYCQASTSSLFDVRSKKWSSKMCGVIGLPETVLPPVRGAGEILGNLLPEVAKELGLSPDVKMITGTGDNPATYLSSGQMASGEPMISLGTSGVLMFSRKKEDRRAKGKPILFSHGGGEFRIIVQGAVQSTGSSFRWWAKDILQGGTFDDISDLVDGSGTINESLLFYPHLAGDKTIYGDPYLRGAFMGIGTDTSRADVTQAILEGIGFAFRQLMEKMHVGTGMHSIKVTGGMARMEVFMQILADILNVNVVVSDNIGAVQGIALLAAHSCGIKAAFDNYSAHTKQSRAFLPRPSFVEVYHRKYRIYTRMYHAVKQVYQE